MLEASTVLYVEDDPSVRFGSSQALQLAGFEVKAFGSAELACPHLTPGFRGVLLTDVKLPGMSGLQLLERAQHVDSDMPVILVTGHGDISMAVKAMRLGAYDFIEKPFSPDQLADVVRRAIEKRNLSLEVESLRTRLSSLDAIEAKIIGRSSAMGELRRVILDIASTNADVLVTGETGTSRNWSRAVFTTPAAQERPFVALNCGGMRDAVRSGSSATRRVVHGAEAARARSSTPPAAPVPRRDRDHARERRSAAARSFRKQFSVSARTAPQRGLPGDRHNQGDLLQPPRDRLSQGPLLPPQRRRSRHPPLRERRQDIPMLFNHFLMQGALRYERPVPRSTAHAEVMAIHGRATSAMRNADRTCCVCRSARRRPQPDGASRALDEQVSLFERCLIEEALAASGGRAVARAASQDPDQDAVRQAQTAWPVANEFKTG
jgi:two-component system C4-dicarboxylate transport response regulator DctD